MNPKIVTIQGKNILTYACHICASEIGNSVTQNEVLVVLNRQAELLFFWIYLSQHASFQSHLFIWDACCNGIFLYSKFASLDGRDFFTSKHGITNTQQAMQPSIFVISILSLWSTIIYHKPTEFVLLSSAAISYTMLCLTHDFDKGYSITWYNYTMPRLTPPAPHFNSGPLLKIVQAFQYACLQNTVTVVPSPRHCFKVRF